MKSMKRKLTLSALALACCLGAGMLSLQSTTADSTATTTVTTNDGLTMENGASVYLGDSFSGIRWKTTVTDDLYDKIQTKTNGSFGVVVAPTAAIEGELTINTPDVINISVGKTFNKVDGVYTYYAAIDFNDIVAQYESENGDLNEEQETALLMQAYEMELTARAYVASGSTYHYADITGVETSRSAKQVAIAAELAGEIDENYRGEDATEADDKKAEKAANYYGKTNANHLTVSAKSNGAAGTKFITADTAETVADYKKVNFAATGENAEVYIGIKKLSADAYTYEDGTLTVTDATGLPVGETYATVLTSEVAKAEPLIVATKVLDEAEDLAMFKTNVSYEAVDGKRAYRPIDESKPMQKLEGYYVLAHNINAKSYDHGKNSAGEAGIANGVGIELASRGIQSSVDYGFFGTFNGLGYTISNMRVRSFGLFGYIVNATIKNVAFANVDLYHSATYKQTSVLAAWIKNSTISDVYISANKSEDITKGGGSVLANGIDASTVTRCIVETNEKFNYTEDTLSYTGSFTYMNKERMDDDEVQTSFNDVYVISNEVLGYYEGTSAAYYLQAENENLTVAEGDILLTMNGVKKYSTRADMPSADNYYASFDNDYWTITDGTPVWKSL